MYSGWGVAGRTRSRQGIDWKQYFDNKLRKQHEIEVISSEGEWSSGGTVSVDDDDVSLIKDIKPEEDSEKEISERIQSRQVLNEMEAKMASQEDCSSSDTIGSSSDDGGGGDCEDSPRGDDEGDVEKDLTGSGRRSTATPPHGDDDVEKDVTRNRGRGVASRTRSHFRVSQLKNTKLGTFNNPISLDDEDGDEQEIEKEEHETPMSPLDEDLASSSTSSDDEDEIPKVRCKRRRKLFDVFKIPPERPHDERVVPLENSTSSNVEERNPNVMAKPLKVSSPSLKLKSEDILERLWAEMNMADENPEESMNKASQSPERPESDEEDGKLWSVSASEDEAGIPEDINPFPSSKSAYGTEASLPLEKSESEDESDLLWAELNDYLLHGEEDTSHPVENGHSDDPNPEGEESVAARCGRGDHVPAMNEEIGLVCIHCWHIVRDIKDCDPEFGKHPSGKPGGRYSYRPGDSDDSFSDDTEHENSGIDDKSSRFLTYASTGTVWDIIPKAKKRMYSHQKEAFEFLWTRIAGDIVLDKLIKRLDFASGGGCIISHAPGTGKTFLTIAFLKAFMRRYPSCRPMIIAPCNILNTWERELNKWQVGDSVPFHNLNKLEFSGEETQSAMCRFRPRRRGSSRKPNINEIRRVKARSWGEAKSILGISYTLFDRLARKGSDYIKKALFELPGLVVLDEGHTPRNARSRLWEALSNIKTKRRIILSGTPFQNNFTELNNTLRLSKPNVTRGNLEFLLKSYDKVENNGERTQVIAQIRDVIKPFVHVHKGTVLEEKLPGLKEAVVSLKPSRTQMFIFEYIQKLREGQEGCSNWFRFEHLMSVASVHPSLFVDELTHFPESDRVQLNAILKTLDSSTEAGVKTKFVLDFIRQSQRMKEKVLIFSQYLQPLEFLAKQINSCFHWREGEQIMIIHGKTPEVARQASIDAFNDPSSKARVMLASTKACYEGINLVGASRVILLDTLWNPSAERQAVSRAYRLGQKKLVYTYRLITAGTWDEHKLCIQAEKDELSELVFSASHEAGHRHNMSPNGFEDKLLEKMSPKFGTKFTKRGVTILIETEK